MKRPISSPEDVWTNNPAAILKGFQRYPPCTKMAALFRELNKAMFNLRYSYYLPVIA